MRSTVTRWPQPRPESLTTCCCTETQCVWWTCCLQRGRHHLWVCGLVEDTFLALCVCVTCYWRLQWHIILLVVYLWQYWGDSVQRRKGSGLWCSLRADTARTSERRRQHCKSLRVFSLSDCFSSTSVSLCCLYNFSDSDFCYFLFDQFSLLKNWSLQLVGLFSHYLHYICLCSSHGLCVFWPSC